MLDMILTDLRCALRSARRSPGFFVLATVILAAGIAMSTAIVTVLHTVALRDLPVPDQDELVVMYAEDPSRGFDHVPLTHAMFEEFGRSTNALSSVGGLQYAGAWPRDFLDGERHVRATGVIVTEGFFETLGRPAALGRTLRSSDQDAGAEPVIVISHGLWQREFGSEPDVLGRRLRFVSGGGLDLTVVGVMPRGFRLPGDADYWLPLERLYRTDDALARVGIDVIGRLAPGTTAEAAGDEYERYLRTQTFSRSDAYAGVSGVAVPLHEAEVGDVRPVLLIVSVAAALLVLIACFNIAILLLMRSSRRDHELHVRSALGASGRRIAGQLMTESAVIAGAGGILGTLLVGPILRLFLRFAPEGLPRLQDLSVSGATLAIGIGTTALVALLAGVVPALSVAGTGRGAVLRSGIVRSTGSGRSVWTRRVLVSAQFGLAVMVLAGAGLVLRSFDRLRSLEPGFEPQGVVHVELAGPLDVLGSPETTRAFFDRLLPALETRSGIERATVLAIGPFSGAGGYDGRYIAEGQTAADAERNPWLNFEIVSPEYFDVFGIAPVAGRLPTEADREGAPLAAIVSEGAAAALWPGEGAVGRRVRTAEAGSPWYEVVGVVPDTRYREYRDPRPSIYFTTGQSPYPFHPRQLAVRTSGPIGPAVSTIRQVAGEIEPGVLVAVVSPMPDLMDEPLAQPRLNALLLTVFAATAMGLAAVGLYGILSFAVGQRRRELGIRQALGASRADVARLVLREGWIVALCGTAVGLALSLALGGTLRAVLYGVSPADPGTFAAALAFLTAVALGACALPARRAAAADPSELLRAD